DRKSFGSSRRDGDRKSFGSDKDTGKLPSYDSFNKDLSSIEIPSKQYKDDNVFAHIIAGKLKCKQVYKSKHVLIFKDHNPQQKIHFLAVPLNKYVDYSDFMQRAKTDEILDFFHTSSLIANKYTNGSFKLAMHTGALSGQEVFHFHMHILSDDIRKDEDDLTEGDLNSDDAKKNL
ncbi:MAG: HIT family protein, partial [Pseudomonadota bacterium]